MQRRKIKTTERPGRAAGIILIALVSCIVFGLVVAILEKTNVIDLWPHNASESQDTNGSNATNINYDPPSKEETDLGNQIKDQAQQNDNSLPPASDSSITVSYSTAGQDEKGGPIVVRTIVGSTTGTCTATLSGVNYTQDFSSTVKDLGAYSSCNFDISVDSVSTGNYTLVVKVKNGSSSGSATQTVEVRK